MSLLGGIIHLTGFSSNISDGEKEDLTSLDKMAEFQKAKAEREKEKLARERERAEEAKERREEKARIEEEKQEKAEDEIEQEKELSNDELKRYTLELRQAMKDVSDGTDTSSEQLDKLISNDDISDSDFAKIVNLYNQRYGNGEQDKLIETLDQELSGDFKNTILGKTAQRLTNAAQDEIDCGNTNGAALHTLSEIVHSSQMDNLSSAAKFIEAVMNADSTQAVSNLLKEKYPEYSQDKNLAENIEQSYKLYNEGDAIDIIDMYS